MNRREYITLLGGATAWPLAAREAGGGGGFDNSVTAGSINPITAEKTDG